jgi:hypothetical protein
VQPPMQVHQCASCACCAAAIRRNCSAAAAIDLLRHHQCMAALGDTTCSSKTEHTQDAECQEGSLP